jgi:mRNA interferase RelE/StbE
MVSYLVQISDKAGKEIRRLPGNFRQRVLRSLRNLEQIPQPVESIRLDLTDSSIALADHMELRRIRLAEWRIIYLIEHDIPLITVLAVRKRPPYQYDDLRELLK